MLPAVKHLHLMVRDDARQVIIQTGLVQTAAQLTITLSEPFEASG
jgi:hypothetical protein